MNHYFEQMILSASPVEMVYLLYQRAMRGVRDARTHLAEGRIAERCEAVNHAWSVLLELTNSLDVERAPEMAGRLGALYAYMQERLMEANLKQQEAPLSEVLMLLTTLAEGWSGVLAEERARQEGADWSEAPIVEGASYRFAVSA